MRAHAAVLCLLRACARVRVPPTQASDSLVPEAHPPESFETWEPQSFFRFEEVHRSRRAGSRARVGRIHTPHGVIDTPGFGDDVQKDEEIVELISAKGQEVKIDMVLFVAMYNQERLN